MRDRHLVIRGYLLVLNFGVCLLAFEFILLDALEEHSSQQLNRKKDNNS